MAREQFHTDYRLWVIAACGLFAFLGFVDPVAGMAKDDNSYWAYLGILLSGNFICGTDELLAAVAFRALLVAIPSTVLGWLLQALLVVSWSIVRDWARARNGLTQTRAE